MLYVVFPPRFNIFPFRFHLRNQVISSCGCIPFIKRMDRLYREFIILLSVMISIFYLPIRYCSLDLQKITVRFSHENVRGCIPFLKSLDRLLNGVNS